MNPEGATRIPLDGPWSIQDYPHLPAETVPHGFMFQKVRDASMLSSCEAAADLHARCILARLPELGRQDHECARKPADQWAALRLGNESERAGASFSNHFRRSPRAGAILQ